MAHTSLIVLCLVATVFALVAEPAPAAVENPYEDYCGDGVLAYVETVNGTVTRWICEPQPAPRVVA